MWQAVQVMTKICAESERSLDYYGLFKQIMKRAPVPMSPLESLASSAVRTAHKVSPLPPFLPCPSFLPPSSLCPPVWSPWRPLLCALLTRSPPPPPLSLPSSFLSTPVQRPWPLCYLLCSRGQPAICPSLCPLLSTTLPFWSPCPPLCCAHCPQDQPVPHCPSPCPCPCPCPSLLDVPSLICCAH